MINWKTAGYTNICEEGYVINKAILNGRPVWALINPDKTVNYVGHLFHCEMEAETHLEVVKKRHPPKVNS